MTNDVVVCPRCGDDFSQVVTSASRTLGVKAMIPEPFDCGRCEACSRTFVRLHSVGTWRPESFAPYCRICRNREVVFDAIASTAERQVYACRVHPRQKWVRDVGADHWTDYSPR